MAGEASGRLDRSSVRLLADAAASLGMTAAIGGTRIRLSDSSGDVVTLVWPARVIAKSHIPRLLDSGGTLRPVPTLRFAHSDEPPFLPGCAKPDRASRGEGFVSFRTPAEWRRRRAALDRSYVVQPFLRGREYRVTVCRSGVFAAAELLQRKGAFQRWRDTPDMPRPLMAELLAIVQRLDRPGIGFDVLRTADGDYLLDVNLFPSLAIHAAGEPPRSIAREFLRDWIDLARRG